MKLDKDLFLYKNKDGRERIVYRNSNGKITSKSYPRFIMEEYLNRELLPDEQVHHRDGDPLNNDISNLEVLKIGEHQKLHNPGYTGIFTKCDICNKQFYWSADSQKRYYTDLKRGKTRYICCSKKCSGIASHNKYRNIINDRHIGSIDNL